jgi:hypothetical protein
MLEKANIVCKRIDTETWVLLNVKANLKFIGVIFLIGKETSS